MGIPYRNPRAEILDLLDAGAWEGERLKAARLEDLQSASGLPYHEISAPVSSTFSSEPRFARTDIREEVAYWCPAEKWVQGAPMGEEYDSRYALSGRSGLRLICRSCGSEVGRWVEIVS